MRMFQEAFLTIQCFSKASSFDVLKHFKEGVAPFLPLQRDFVFAWPPVAPHCRIGFTLV